MKTTRFQLETLTCPSCVTRIEGVLNNEPGVAKAKVLFNSSSVRVEYDAEKVTTEKLVEVIQKVGYPVLS